VAALRLHAGLLRTLVRLRRGDNKAAAPAAEALPALLARAREAATPSYEWLSLPALDALLRLVRLRSARACLRAAACVLTRARAQVAAVCDRPWSSKMKSAREHAEAALAIATGAHAAGARSVACHVADACDAAVRRRAHQPGRHGERCRCVRRVRVIALATRAR
jgi:hypothetical protein